jgi:hypothetical protein
MPFYSILFYSILFYSILFYSILFYYIILYYIVHHSILFYSILFYSILFYSILGTGSLIYHSTFQDLSLLKSNHRPMAPTALGKHIIYFLPLVSEDEDFFLFLGVVFISTALYFRRQ